eukprot:SAG31_NODE_2133_length_6372_cov_4.372071_7_plen_83_part_00
MLKQRIVGPFAALTKGWGAKGGKDLVGEFKKAGKSSPEIVALVNKAPVWSAEKNMYILDFKGRVTQASMRNFQAVRSENGAQ